MNADQQATEYDEASFDSARLDVESAKAQAFFEAEERAEAEANDADESQLDAAEDRYVEQFGWGRS